MYWALAYSWSFYRVTKTVKTDLSALIVVGTDEREEELIDEGRRLTDDEDDNDDDHDQREVVFAAFDRHIAAHYCRKSAFAQSATGLDQLVDETGVEGDEDQQWTEEHEQTVENVFVDNGVEERLFQFRLHGAWLPLTLHTTDIRPIHILNGLSVPSNFRGQSVDRHETLPEPGEEPPVPPRPGDLT